MRKVSRWQLSGVPMLGLVSILEQTVKSLHEANEHPSTDASEQYTILDGLKLLSDPACTLGQALLVVAFAVMCMASFGSVIVVGDYSVPGSSERPNVQRVPWAHRNAS